MPALPASHNCKFSSSSSAYASASLSARAFLIDVAARLTASAFRPPVFFFVFRRGRFERVRRALFFEAPDFVKLRRDFCDEAGGALENCLAAGIVCDHEGVCDVAL